MAKMKSRWLLQWVVMQLAATGGIKEFSPASQQIGK